MALDTTVGGPLSDSYGTLVQFKTYCSGVGKIITSYTDAQCEAALRRAVVWLDGFFQDRWPGTRANGRSQALSWPRVSATDMEGLAVDSASIPPEVVRAQFEAAIVELFTPFALTPSSTPGQDKVLVEVDDMRWVPLATQQPRTRNPMMRLTSVDSILSPLVPMHSQRKHFTV